MLRKPSIFVGSSSERIFLANAVQELLAPYATVSVWNHTFKLGSGTLESLEQQLALMDFAVLILAAEDITISRGDEMLAPRDNVLFELGLFLGRLGRERAFYLYDDAIKVKLPTDLAGITGASYSHGDNLLAALGPACNRIRRRVVEMGLRFKPDNETQNAFEHHYAFRESLIGRWWQFILSPQPRRISFVRIEPDHTISTLKFRGDAYDSTGVFSRHWESIGTILHRDEQRVCYTWKGWDSERPDEPYEGFGDVVFNETSGGLDSGSGTFFNINVTKLSSAMKESFRMQRCTQGEIDTMMKSSDQARSALAQKRLAAM
jgi:hypothetical protein